MLFAIEDALTGGGIVGGAVTAAGALYLIWEKASKRRTEARREALADEARRLKLLKARAEIEAATEESRVKIGQMARTELTAAFEAERAARRAAHDADIRAIRREIEANRERLNDLERQERACQVACEGLKAQNTAQAAEIVELRAKIVRLEQKLKDAGALPPGTDHHVPLE